jgi:predicted metal-dependent peptidase
LINFCTNFKDGFDALVTKQFPMQRSVVDWCIDVIINTYITETANIMSGRLKIRYLCSANDAKQCWTLERNARLQEEQYLQNNDFQAELNGSSAEFYEEIENVIGCTPKKWHSVN